MTEKLSGLVYGVAVSLLLAGFAFGSYVYLPQYHNIYAQLPDIHGALAEFIFSSFKFWAVLPILAILGCSHGLWSGFKRTHMNLMAALVAVALILLVMGYFSIIQPIEELATGGVIYIPQVNFSFGT